MKKQRVHRKVCCVDGAPFGRSESCRQPKRILNFELTD
jgi:hypothetical protein